MIDGLWTVEFISTMNRSGKGVLVLSNGRLLGGDEGYYYSGTYHLAGKTIQGKVNVVRFDPNTLSVFGDIDHFTILFYGDINDYNFTAAATIEENPKFKIKVVANKKEDM